ncbi:MAG: HEAT repeat domain-containing protein [Spirochaetaceae bacterium]|nr:MAG: HEAT repeat domain-containing protein [Spirochaetaceae bacterium]
MKTRVRYTVFLLSFFLLFGGGLYAQNDRLEMFQSNFASANLQTKMEILRAAGAEDPARFGPLYRQAIEHVINNSGRITGESMLREMAMLATNRIDDGSYSPAAADLWRLFQDHGETSFRIRALEVLGNVGSGNPDVVEGVIDWVRRQHVVSEGGGRPDLQVLAAAVDTLGEFGDSRAFAVLIDTVLLQYPGFVTASARRSLAGLEGDVVALSLSSLRSRPLLERRPLFSLLLTAGFLDEGEQRELSRELLADTLNVSTSDLRAQEEARQIRFAAAQILRDGRYDPATPQVIRHFNQTVLEFERGRISSGPLLEAVATVGAMGNEDAAQRLTQYLDLLNTYTESDRPQDTQIMLAVIGNLETLGSPIAYNSLFYTTMLENYPRTVRERARQAAMAVAR